MEKPLPDFKVLELADSDQRRFAEILSRRKSGVHSTSLYMKADRRSEFVETHCSKLSYTRFGYMKASNQFRVRETSTVTDETLPGDWENVSYISYIIHHGFKPQNKAV
jgi:hypothetical protein